jgi:hypothetical protein
MLKLERRFPQMPRLRRPAVSALWSLLGDKQTSRGQPTSVAIDPTQTSSDVGSCAALGGTADMTESSVLSYESTDQVEFRCGFPRSPAPPQPGPKSQQSTASNGHGRRGLTSRGGRAKMGRCVLLNDWIRAAANAVAFIRTRHAAAAKDPIKM